MQDRKDSTNFIVQLNSMSTMALVNPPPSTLPTSSSKQAESAATAFCTKNRPTLALNFPTPREKIQNETSGNVRGRPRKDYIVQCEKTFFFYRGEGGGLATKSKGEKIQNENLENECRSHRKDFISIWEDFFFVTGLSFLRGTNFF